MSLQIRQNSTKPVILQLEHKFLKCESFDLSLKVDNPGHSPAIRFSSSPILDHEFSCEYGCLQLSYTHPFTVAKVSWYPFFVSDICSGSLKNQFPSRSRLSA